MRLQNRSQGVTMERLDIFLDDRYKDNFKLQNTNRTTYRDLDIDQEKLDAVKRLVDHTGDDMSIHHKNYVIGFNHWQDAVVFSFKVYKEILIRRDQDSQSYAVLSMYPVFRMDIVPQD